MANNTDPTPPGILTRIVNKIRTYAKGNQKKVLAVESEEVNHREERDKLLQQILDTSLDFPDDDNHLITAVNRHITTFTNHYNAMGVLDGLLVAKNYDILTLTTNHSTRIVEQVVSKLQSTKASLTDQLITKSEIKKLRMENHLRWVDFNDQMTGFYQSSHRNFSKGIAITCLCFGFLLMITDLPLSLALVGHFDIGSGSKLFKDQLKDPGLVLFALGIAFCTVYMKIFYDEYINTDIGEWKLKFSKLSKQETGDSELADEATSGKRSDTKLTVKVWILVGLIITLIALGIFRNMYSKLGGVISDSGGHPLFNIYFVLLVRLVCFVGMTLIIPVISGVCMSIGFSIFHHRSIKNEAARKMKETEGEVKAVDKEISELKKIDGRLGFFLQEWAPKRIATISAEFTDYYNQGYKRGYIVEHGNDPFPQIQQLYNDQTIKYLTKVS